MDQCIEPHFFNLLLTVNTPSFCCFFKDGLLLGKYVHLSAWKVCSPMSPAHCSLNLRAPTCTVLKMWKDLLPSQCHSEALPASLGWVSCLRVHFANLGTCVLQWRGEVIRIQCVHLYTALSHTSWAACSECRHTENKPGVMFLCCQDP